MEGKFIRKYIEGFLSFFVSFAVYFCALPLSINSNNMIYAIGQIHSYDNTLFKDSVYVEEGIVSPRYFLDSIFSLVMKLNGGKWQDIAVAFIYIGILILAVATTMLVYKITDHGQLLFTAILSFFFTQNISPQAGGFDLFNMTTIGMGTAYAIVIMAIAFAAGKKKNFNLSWFALACAVMFHVHEGIYGFAVVFIFFLIDTVHRKKLCLTENLYLLIYFLALMAAVLPNMLTDTLNISNEEFVWIYADYRHSHHLLPSTWKKAEILSSMAIILLPGILRIEQLLLIEEKNIKNFIEELGLFIFAWGGVYAVMYIGTEKLHIVSVTVLFLSKFLKYVSVVSLIWYIKTANSYFEKKDFLTGFLVLTPALIIHLWNIKAGIFACLCIIAYIYYEYRIKEQDDRNKEENIVFTCLIGCIYAALLLFNLSGRMLVIFGVIIVLVYAWVFFEVTSRKIYKFAAIVSAIMLISWCCYGKLYLYSDGKISFVASTDILMNSSGGDIYQLAQNFKNMTDITDSYIADPEYRDNVGWFQIISERNCYVIKKVVPSTKATMKEWYDRCRQTENIFEKDVDEIIKIMNDSGNRYILVKSENYEKFDASGFFQCFTECDGDSYRVYEFLNTETKL